MQKLLTAIAALLALFVVVGLSIPRYSRIEVSTTIDANPATVFALINEKAFGTIREIEFAKLSDTHVVCWDPVSRFRRPVRPRPITSRCALWSGPRPG